MPQDPAAALSSLLRASSIDDHAEILKAANAAIRANKNDTTSQHTRIVALLKLDRFEDALRAIAEGGSKLDSTCALEKAYALYKIGKLDEATSVLKAGNIESRGFSHAAAQIAYRAERFDEARAIYRRLLDTDASDEENDMRINLRAACAQSEWQGSPATVLPEVQDSDGFEICYNAACACIARGSLGAAANLLQRALKLCHSSDDLSEEDKHDEMQPILAQQAFVFAKMGKLKEALDLYKSLATTSDNDPEVTVIAQNNLLAMEAQADNPYLLQRKFELLTAGNKAAKFSSHQSKTLRQNGLVIDLQAHKTDGVKKSTAKILGQVQHPTNTAGTNLFAVLNAAASAQGATGKQLIRNLLNLTNKRPHDVGLVLTIIQIQLQNEHSGAALSTLESFLQRLEKSEDSDARDVRFSPGLVALGVALMRAQGRESSAKAELVRAATHWQGHNASPAASLLREAGVELLKSSNHQDLQLAGSSFQKLLEEQQGSLLAAAGLVASLAPSDPAKIQKHLTDLPPVETLINGVDVEELIGAGVATTAKSAQGLKRLPLEEPTTRVTKRRRKTKLPKNYEEGKAPDPERWLPLRDRSTYRPKGKKGKKKAGESTQGGIVKEEETLELVGGGGVKVEKASGNSKKKKKGKK